MNQKREFFASFERNFNLDSHRQIKQQDLYKILFKKIRENPLKPMLIFKSGNDE